MRLVLGTIVVASGLLWEGTRAQLLDAGEIRGKQAIAPAKETVLPYCPDCHHEKC